MDIARTSRTRAGRILEWAIAGLLAMFVVLIACQKYLVLHHRFKPDADLMEELASASIVEDRTGLDPKSWTQWRGNRRDAVTTAPDLLVDWPAAGPKRVWRVDGGDGYSSFAVSGDSLYTMIGADGKEAVVCWNVADGNERWRHFYDPAASFQYGGPRATPTIDGDRLYTVSSSGILMCLDTKAGKVIWEHDLTQEMAAEPPKWGFAFSPLVEGDRVFTTPGGSNGRCLAAFAKSDGKLLWATQDDPAGYSSPVATTIAGVRQVVFFTGRRLLGVSPEDGKLLWEYPWHTEFEVNAATPVVFHARAGSNELTYIFISSGYEKGCALVKILASDSKFSAKSVYESNELCCHFASPVRHGEYIYGLDEKRDLTCIAIRSGEVAWRQRGFQKGSLLCVDDRLIVLGENGKLALIDASPDGFKELASFRPFRDRCWTLPALADGRLFLRDQRRVICLDVRRN